MANSDGQVRIYIDTNAKQAAKELDSVNNAFNKNADTMKKASSATSAYEQVVQDNIRVLKESALGGNSNTEAFKKLAAETKNYQDALNKANNEVNKALGQNNQQTGQINKLAGAVKGLVGAYLGVQGIRMVINYSNQAVAAFRTQERAVLQLNQTLQNAGVYSYEYSQNIQKLASEIQGYSNFGDEAIIKAQALGQAYIGNTKITNELTKAVVDFAAATGMDLESAFTLVGKSIGSQTNALGRYGISLQKGMSESQKMEAITRQLGQRYEGTAAKMADTSVQLQNALGDLSEEFGNALNPTVTKTQNILIESAKALTEWIRRVRIMKRDLKELNITELNDRLKEVSEYKAQLASGTFDKSGVVADVNTKGVYGDLARKYAKEQQDIIAQIKKLRKEEEELAELSKLNGNKNKLNDEFGLGSGTSVSAEKIKDAFEKAQEEAQKAEKAFKLALYQSGGNVTPAVEQARLKMVDTKKAVEDVQKAYEKLTATAKTPFEQLNYNIEQSRQKIISLASQPVVNIEAIRQAQTEYQGFLAQQEQINAYLQPAKGHLEELNLKIQETQRLLGELYFTKGVNSEEFIKAKNELVQLQTTAKNVNTAITSQVGVDWANISESIKSNLSSAILTPLQEGESAFDRLAKIGLNAVQLVGQEIIKNLMEQITLEKTLAAIKTAGKAIGSLFGFGFKDGAAFKNGNVIPYAKGGVVSKPTIFPMANGGTGLMGEAGAEAVMPLRRMSNGRLGVEAENNNGKAVNVNIYNQSGANVETRKRDDGSMDIFIRKVNEALSSERTSSGFRSAYAREDRKGVQAV